MLRGPSLILATCLVLTVGLPAVASTNPDVGRSSAQLIETLNADRDRYDVGPRFAAGRAPTEANSNSWSSQGLVGTHSYLDGINAMVNQPNGLGRSLRMPLQKQFQDNERSRIYLDVAITCNGDHWNMNVVIGTATGGLGYADQSIRTNPVRGADFKPCTSSTSQPEPEPEPKPAPEPDNDDADGDRQRRAFSDINPDTELHDSAAELAELGIVRGYDDGTYRPSDLVTRQATAAFVSRLIETLTGDVLPETTTFSDATGVHGSAMNKLGSAGIAQGNTAGEFQPTQPVTRGQMATMLVRTFELLDLPDPIGDVVFSDADGHTHEDAIRELAATGVTTGYVDGTFRPGETVTRSQMALFLGRTLHLVATTGYTLDDA